MILYVDTSSLLKCFVGEAYSAHVREWMAAADAVATSRVTYPEAAAAVARRQRRGDLAPATLRRVLHRLADRWSEFMLVDVAEILAGGLAVHHALRGFDAVQLAAAMTLRDAVGSDGLAFSSFDGELNRAAVSEGLIVLEPGDD